MRKTIHITVVRDSVNNALCQPGGSPERRQGMIDVLTHVLHESGNYFGFRYLSSEELPEGELPGVRLDDNGELLDGEERFADTDRTRVHYF